VKSDQISKAPNIRVAGMGLWMDGRQSSGSMPLISFDLFRDPRCRNRSQVGLQVDELAERADF